MGTMMKKNNSHFICYIAIFLFLVLIVSDSIPQEAPDEARGLTLIEQGEELYIKGDYVAALELLFKAKKLVKEKKNLPRLYFQLSLVYYALGSTLNTEENLRKMFEIEPGKKIEEERYPRGYLEIYQRISKEFPVAPPTPKVMVKEIEAKPRRKKGNALLYIIGGLAVAGGAAALLLGKKGARGEGPSGQPAGSIQVNSSPAGAHVYLNGNSTGQTTNCTLANVSAGSHTVKLVKEGYKDYQESVSVTAGQTTTMNVNLTKHTISVTSPKSSTIWVIGDEVDIKWTYDGSLSSQGNIKTGTTLNPGLSKRPNSSPFFHKRLERHNILSQGLIKQRRETEEFRSSRERRRISSKTSKIQLIPEKMNINPPIFSGSVYNLPSLSHQHMPLATLEILTLTNVKIELYKGNNLTETISSSTENDGTYKWRVPNSLIAGENYKARISCVSEPSVNGERGRFKIRTIPAIKWVRVPAGTFEMGDNFNEGESDEWPVHTVYLDTYYISKYEVTFEQYYVFCNATGRIKPSDEGWGRGKRPVMNVSWEDAKAFCDWLSSITGTNIHLPTEAQWEKAARGTNQRRHPWGNKSPSSSLANYNRNAGKTMPVGSYPSGVSPYGIHDMAGNVWEWCLDWYDSDYYSRSPRNNPQGPSVGSTRLRRGGGWVSKTYYIRSANRGRDDPSYRYNDIGFRLCKD